MLEAIGIAESLAGRPMQTSYDPQSRTGDHIWWVSDTRKFQAMYPEWSYGYDIHGIMADIHAGLSDRLPASADLIAAE